MMTTQQTGQAVETVPATETPPDRPNGRGQRGIRRVWQNTATARADALAKWIARFLRGVALFSALTGAVPATREILAPVRRIIEWTTIGAQPNLAYAVYLGILAAAVSRRKRLAWWFLVITIVLPNLAFGVLEVIMTGRGYLSIGILTVVLAVLLLARPAFDAKVAPRAGWRALGTLLLTGCLGFVLGTATMMLFSGRDRPFPEEMIIVLAYITGGTSTWNNPELISELHVAPPPHLVIVFLGVLAAIVQLASAWVLFQPRRRDLFQTPDDELGIRALLRSHGAQDSLGYFATRRDKSALWAPDRSAAITYRVVAGVSLASGDPVGDPAHWRAAIDAWLAEAHRFAWTPAVMGAGEAGAKAYVDAGLDAIELGDEAVVHVQEFGRSGRNVEAVRRAARRLEHAGYTCRIRRHDEVSPTEFAVIASAAGQWRGNESERGFSMALGRLGDPRDMRCVLVECLAPDGLRRAVLSFVPWGTDGLSLDLMRRDPSAPSGTVELMVTKLVENAERLGVRRISLNFAMFRNGLVEGAQIGAGPVARVWRRTLLIVSRWWQIESLYRANLKFDPEWMPRFLCYPRSRDLPRIGVATGVSEGFLPHRRTDESDSRGTGGVALTPDELSDWDPWPPPPDPEQLEAERVRRLPEQERVRRAKLDRVRAEGIDPYPVNYPRTATTAEIRDRYPNLPADTWTDDQVGVAGRVILMRKLGGLSFATLRDGTGDLQVMMELTDAGAAESFARWKRHVDIGDHVGVTGVVGTTRTGELTVRGTRWALTSKCLRPLPDKHRGLTDPEARARHRALDLTTRPEARRTMHQRIAAVQSVREVLHGRDFLEVETPMLHTVHGGANARPFQTHINAYDLPLYLRIAPELYLKRLLVGGAERIFELNRNFRNEGADATHNPEFTMLEAYQTYADYLDMQAVIRDVVLAACLAVHGDTICRRRGSVETDEGRSGVTEELDLSAPWRSAGIHELVSERLGEPITPELDLDRLRSIADRAGVSIDGCATPGAAVVELYEHLVEPNLREPTFVCDYPLEESPLTRQHREDPRLAERWDLIVFGMEIGTAYSELVDPVEQRRRLTLQSLRAAGGDPEAMQLDEDFLHALEFGMPPAGGLGLGIDRLLMTLTGGSIRDTLLFPLVRPGRR